MSEANLVPFSIPFLLSGQLVFVVVSSLVLVLSYAAFYVKLLDQDEQLVVEGISTKTVVNGPKVVFLPLLSRKSQKRKALTLEPTMYAVISNRLLGEKRVEMGPKLVFLGPYETEVACEMAFTLKANEFIRFSDHRTGKVRVVQGEQGCVVPGPHEEVVMASAAAAASGDNKVQQALNLRVFEYVRIQDMQTGAVRVERGEKLVFLGPFEHYLGSKETAVEIDDETAVLVRNKRTGQQHLVTEKKLFFPTEDEQVLEVRKLIKLADHEACIVRDKDGRDEFYFGKQQQRSFFLKPYSSLVTLNWSRGRRREQRDLFIQKIDLRPMFMSFEFSCRTNDNVELVLEGSFFWEIVDLEGMHRFTNDTTGDICNHARSRFIELVSKRTLVQFMAEFNEIAAEVHQEDDSGFYKQRGVKIHSLEVTAYRCADPCTAAVLQEIIQETTNRVNRLQQQESENEVRLKEICGGAEEEKARSVLLEIQSRNTIAKAEMEGQAEAQRAKSFLGSLSTAFPDMPLDKIISMWQTLRKEDALKAVSVGKAQVFFTPAGANLAIEHHTHEV